MFSLPLLMFHILAGQDATISQAVSSAMDIGKVYACPRCRRAKPPGPRKGASPSKKGGSNDE